MDWSGYRRCLLHCWLALCTTSKSALERIQDVLIEQLAVHHTEYRDANEALWVSTFIKSVVYILFWFFFWS
jgi:hypothetical protein